jgi:hypothetical protein
MPEKPPRQLVPPPPQAPLGGLATFTSQLAALLEKPVVRGVWYNGKEVPLDGFKFIECRFDNCVLRLNSTEFELDRCFIDPTTKFSYGASAARVIQLFMSPLAWLDKYYPSLAPERNADGTITIKGSRVG